MSDRPTFDQEFVLNQTGGDQELMGEVLALFLTETPRMLEDVRAAVTSGDAGTVERTAHRLKGSLVAIAAQPAADEALRLETLGRQGEVASASQVLSCLEQEIDRLMPEIRQVTGAGS
ncbi:hypothetical protein ABI59_18390 [Acidobacteria bacterium Mor1]|nr:hypothetical protein ABI59_18390 [Acidobacteria bacterium Mor1]